MAPEMEKKKPKMGEGPDPATCSFWVPRKKRRCKMTANKGSPFCGAHAPPTPQPDTDADAAAGGDSPGERVPCPLDPKHTVFRRKLAKHLAICNAREQERPPPYIVRNINSGGDAQPAEELEGHSRIKLHELPDEEFYGLIAKVRALHAEHVQDTIQASAQETRALHGRLEEELGREEYGQETRRQLAQTASLLGMLERDKQLTQRTSYVEFGAGKGQLAYYLATLLEERQLADSQVVLVDRLSLRHKKDNKVANRQLVQRIRADIADLKLSALPQLARGQRTVALSKHLCGAATDLTLRCILGDGAAAVDYVLIALCCHHRCSWPSYVGRAFFEACGIGARHFAVLTKMASWAVCGTGLSRERRRAMELAGQEAGGQPEEATAQRLGREEREEIGLQCKRLLDFGRLQHLRSKGYQAELKFYVPREMTLENVVLVAQRTGAAAECPNKDS
ncbi:hypothetical protein KR018_007907 [Drosophila ironensis]|nr:hypothetical protein KR018_007907 [Drosophila ironensis]